MNNNINVYNNNLIILLVLITSTVMALSSAPFMTQHTNMSATLRTERCLVGDDQFLSHNINNNNNYDINHSNNEFYACTSGENFKMAMLRRQARQLYLRDGYVLLGNILSENEKSTLISWITQISQWPVTPGKWMNYYESVNNVETLCRTENFLPFHEGVRTLLTEGNLVEMLSDIIGETAVVFKEKINYKHAGGGGFPAHQDAPAFKTFNQKHHVTLNIAIDAATIENGCLEVSPGNHVHGLLPQNNINGGISSETEGNLAWIPVPMKPGDVLIFSSYLPHRSGPNKSNNSRRSLYVTYNGKEDGDFRELYYQEKRTHFPPKIERIPGKDYSEGAKVYNLATPITN